MTEIGSYFGECVRILCVGDDTSDLVDIQVRLDIDVDFVLVACPEEGHAALASEGPFDIIVHDRPMCGELGVQFLIRLGMHSPDAERIILAPRDDRASRDMAANDGRVMRLLCRPCPPAVLRDAVWDALLRHRARGLRATTVPRVTPAGAHPCCARVNY